MRKKLFSVFNTSCLVLTALCAIPAQFCLAQEDDYLTDKEIEQLRTEEGKEPPERIRLLTDFLNARFEHARSVKTGTPYLGKDAKEKSSVKKKGPVPDEKKEAPPDTQSPKSFKAWMAGYLKCLDEISTNVDDFSSVRLLEPKPYLKALKSLGESLEEHQKWLVDIQDKVDRPGKEVFDDARDALRDLLEDVRSNIDELNSQIEAMKESKKSKSSSP